MGNIVALQTLFFGISADASGRSLLEEYIFNFDFSEGGARLDLTTDGKSFSSSKAAAGQVTTSVIEVMRSLFRVRTWRRTDWAVRNRDACGGLAPVYANAYACCDASMLQPLRS